MVSNIFGRCHREFSQDTTALKSHCREKCLKYRDTRSNAKVEEKGKSIVFENPDNMEVVCYRVDGGIVGQDSCKCDNLLLFVDNRQAIFIELKGVNVLHALEQINTAVNLLGKDLSDFEWHGRIIASSCIPNIQNDSKFVVLLKDLKKHNSNATLILRENKQKEKVGSLKRS
jgi:hypothetical protein